MFAHVLRQITPSGDEFTVEGGGRILINTSADGACSCLHAEKAPLFIPGLLESSAFEVTWSGGSCREVSRLEKTLSLAATPACRPLAMGVPRVLLERGSGRGCRLAARCFLVGFYLPYPWQEAPLRLTAFSLGVCTPRQVVHPSHGLCRHPTGYAPTLMGYTCFQQVMHPIPRRVMHAPDKLCMRPDGLCTLPMSYACIPWVMHAP